MTVKRLPDFTPPTIRSLVGHQAGNVKNTTYIDEVLVSQHVSSYFDRNPEEGSVEMLVNWTRKPAEVLTFSREDRSESDYWTVWRDEVTADADAEVERMRTKVF